MVLPMCRSILSLSSCSVILEVSRTLLPRYSTEPIRCRSLTMTRTITPVSPLSDSLRISSTTPGVRALDDLARCRLRRLGLRGRLGVDLGGEQRSREDQYRQSHRLSSKITSLKTRGPGAGLRGPEQR